VHIAIRLRLNAFTIAYGSAGCNAALFRIQLILPRASYKRTSLYCHSLE